MPMEDGTQLEGVLYENAHSESCQNVGVVLIHPYSMLGGCMYDYVVAEVCRQAQTSGVCRTVLTYNQRGVGESGGSRWNMRNITGKEDAADVPRVVEYLVSVMKKQQQEVQQQVQQLVVQEEENDQHHGHQQQHHGHQQQHHGHQQQHHGHQQQHHGHQQQHHGHQQQHHGHQPTNSVKIVVIGFSFGAALATCALHHPNIIAYCGISFPLGMSANLLHAATYFEKLVHGTHVDRLLVIGEQDQFTNVRRFTQRVGESGGRLYHYDSNTQDVSKLEEMIPGMLLKGMSVPGMMGQGSGKGTSSRNDTPSNRAATEGEPCLPLNLVLFDQNDHFWANDLALMVNFVMSYLSSVLEKRL